MVKGLLQKGRPTVAGERVMGDPSGTSLIWQAGLPFTADAAGRAFAPYSESLSPLADKRVCSTAVVG